MWESGRELKEIFLSTFYIRENPKWESGRELKVYLLPKGLSTHSGSENPVGNWKLGCPHSLQPIYSMWESGRELKVFNSLYELIYVVIMWESGRELKDELRNLSRNLTDSLWESGRELKDLL